MSKIYLRQINLRRWFPPEDRFAACVARLCILREDFAIEMSGLYQRSIKPLDTHSAIWRRLYFWRNLVRTLLEIRKALESLNTVPEFKRLLKKQSTVWQKKFGAMVHKLGKAAPLVEEIRNSLGGHVLQRGVEKALDNMARGRWGYIEVGKVLGKTHYKFAGELVSEILLAGVLEKDREKVLEEQFTTLAGLFPVFELTDIILTMYISARHLDE